MLVVCGGIGNNNDAAGAIKGYAWASVRFIME
jgi:hypothetical protein